MESKKRTTKSGQVKKHLFDKGKIDSWTAIQLYSATRLSAIIFNLRNKGLNIISKPDTIKDRNGNVCNFVIYNLINQ